LTQLQIENGKQINCTAIANILNIKSLKLAHRVVIFYFETKMRKRKGEKGKCGKEIDF
jgi:hypothetical protein